MKHLILLLCLASLLPAQQINKTMGLQSEIQTPQFKMKNYDKLYDQLDKQFEQAGKERRSKGIKHFFYRTFQTSLALSSVALIGAGAYYSYQVNQDVKKQRDIQNQYFALNQNATAAQFQSLKSQFNTLDSQIQDNTTLSNIFVGAGSAMGIAFTFTFDFKLKYHVAGGLALFGTGWFYTDKEF